MVRTKQESYYCDCNCTCIVISVWIYKDGLLTYEKNDGESDEDITLQSYFENQNTGKMCWLTFFLLNEKEKNNTTISCL